MPETPYNPGDRVLIEAEVIKVQPDGSMILKLSNSTHNIFTPEQVTKKP